MTASPTDATSGPAGEAGPQLVLKARLFGTAFVLVQHLSRAMDGRLRPLGLTTRQWLLLAVLSRADHPLSLSEAAAHYGSSRQNVKQVARGLERQGFLRLVTDPRDARTVRLHLTDAVGVFDEPANAAAGAAFLAELFGDLDRAELETLDELLRRWLSFAAGDAATALRLRPGPSMTRSPRQARRSASHDPEPEGGSHA